MKKLVLLLSIITSLTLGATAQSIRFENDTVAYSPVGNTTQIVGNYLNNTTSSDTFRVKWRVIYSDFPSDWMDIASAAGVCDNSLCYTFSSIWPSGTTQLSSRYNPGRGDFHMQINLHSATSTGRHYITIKAYKETDSTDADTTTFAISKVPTSIANTSKTIEDIRVYPNPASNEINMIFDNSADVKTIALYNNIGKVVAVYKVGGTSANLNLENVPSGLYFARLINAMGGVVSTVRFTRQ